MLKLKSSMKLFLISLLGVSVLLICSGAVHAQPTISATLAKPQDLTTKIANCPASAKPGHDLGATFQVTATNHGDTSVKDIAVDIILRADTSCPTPAPYAIYSPNYSNGA
jgi:hypothetical protein